jgi:hypothetical protein
MKPVLLIALLTSLLWLALAATGAESTADDRTKGEGQAMIDVQPTENKPDRVVMARVGDAEITVEDYIGFISLNPERVRASRGTAGKAEVLRIMIENVLLQQVMAKEGLLPAESKPEDYQKAYQSLASKYFPAPEITDEATLLAYYEANRETFGIPASARLSQIQFRFPKDADDAAKQEVKVRADAALRRIEDGASFAEVAREVSENPGAKAQGGDLGFIERITWSAWLIDALDGVGVGKHTGVLPSPVGYEILMVTEERPAIITPFPEVKEAIRRQLQLEAQSKLQREYVRRLSAETKIVIELDELKDAYPNGIFP